MPVSKPDSNGHDNSDVDGAHSGAEYRAVPTPPLLQTNTPPIHETQTTKAAEPSSRPDGLKKMRDRPEHVIPPPAIPISPNALSNSGIPSNLGGPPPLPKPPTGAAQSPPLHSVEARTPVTGVGSARGVFWRDEMPIAEDQGGESEEEPQVIIQREAPPWLISLVVHLLGMLILALIATPYGRQVGSLVLELGAATDGGEDLESFEIEAASPDISDGLSDNFEVVDTEVFETPVEVFTPEALVETLTPVESNITNVALAHSGMMSGRSGASKEALLAAFGGTKGTEDAVQLALLWLSRQQESKGSWSLRGPYADGAGNENRTAATAMALLAFQGNGNTHQSGPYKDVVRKGIAWLVRAMNKNGFMAEGLPKHHQMYAQAQATIVLCELYAMTGDSWLREPAQKALDFAQEAQSSEGGWRYEPRKDSDTSVTGWFVMAMQSGRAAGLNVNDSALQQVGYFLDSVQHYEGAAYSYQRNGGPSQTMTAEGMLCRQYLGWTRESVAMSRCVNSLVADYGFDISEKDFYYWYYATQVLHHYGGTPWRIWNEKMRVQLPDAQVKDGREAGSWVPTGSRWGSQAGRLYTTCMAVYCLEVYYRHMPLYDVELN